MPKIYLIDGNALCYRSFYAIRDLTRSDGMPTGAIYGFAVRLLKLVREIKPDYLAVTFDRPEKTFRHKAFEEYKAHRTPMPDPLVRQMEPIKEMIECFGVPVFQKAGYEADDILATIAKQASGKKIDVYILTGDKDIMQIINEHIRIVNPNKGDAVIDQDVFEKEYGMPPRRMVDLLSLTGDAADGIPGVPGVGIKTAVKLLREFGSVEKVMKYADSIKRDTLRQNIMKHINDIKRAQSLLVLDEHVPLELDWDKCRTPRLKGNETILKLFEDYEFFSLLKKVDSASKKQAAGRQAELLSVEADVIEYLARIRESEENVCMLYDHERDIILVKGDGQDKICQIKLNKINEEKTIFNATAGLFLSKKQLKIGFSVKELVKRLHKEGLEFEGDYFDLQIAAYLLDPEKSAPGLGDMGLKYSNVSFEPLDSSLARAGECLSMKGLYDFFIKELSARKLSDVWEKIEKPIMLILARMEETGIRIDPDHFKRLKKEFQKEIDIIQKEIYKTSGEEFNINSPKQLGNILFQKLKLPVIKKTKTGASTNVEVLERLSAQHKLPRLVLEYRHLAKLISTYVIPLYELRDTRTNRIHTTFVQTGTATGRLASRDPNLQNIPVKSKHGEKIRCGFIPDKSSDVLISADYSQIELRILAHMSGDPVLTKAFLDNRDIHAHTASLLYDTPESDITQEMRRTAKTVNFGIIYGMSAYGLARDLQIGPDEAQKFINRYFGIYKGIKTFTEALLEKAGLEGYVTTIFGRRRSVNIAGMSQGPQKAFAQRIAVNAPIQGTAADIIKLAMIAIEEKIFKASLRARMILQIHDELIFNVPKSEIEKAKSMIRSAMQECVHLSVPCLVNISIGENWAEL